MIMPHQEETIRTKHLEGHLTQLRFHGALRSILLVLVLGEAVVARAGTAQATEPARLRRKP
jgi:hypothetical protein